MPEPQDPADWKSLAAQLIAHREEDKRTWGPVDDLVIAQYLSGASSESEQRRVEKWMRDYPAVAELVELVKAALTDTPAFAATDATASSGLWTETSATVSLLNETLSAWLDAAGELVTDGLATFGTVSEPQLVGGRAMDENSPRSRSWEVPLLPTDHILRLRITSKSAQEWTLTLQTIPSMRDVRIEISRPGESAELSDRLESWEKRQLPIETGSWILELRTAERGWQFAFVVGRSSP